MAIVFMMSFTMAQDIRSIDQMISIETDGSALIQMDISINAVDSLRSILIPAGFDALELQSIIMDEEDTGLVASLVMERTSPTHEILFTTPIVGTHTIKLESTIAEFLDWDAAGPEEFKTYNWEVVYTNTMPQIVDRCELTILLPLGWNFHHITSSDPKFKKKDPKPPYVFTLMDDRASVSIARSPMQYMESVAIEFGFKKEEKPNILIWVGILLSALYLFYFRHLVLRRDAEKSIDTKNDKESK